MFLIQNRKNSGLAKMIGPFTKGIEKPINVQNPEEVMEARENVARICENVFGRRGETSRNVNRPKR